MSWNNIIPAWMLMPEDVENNKDLEMNENTQNTMEFISEAPKSAVSPELDKAITEEIAEGTPVIAEGVETTEASNS